jgi:hypothetical protein
VRTHLEPVRFQCCVLSCGLPRVGPWCQCVDMDKGLARWVRYFIPAIFFARKASEPNLGPSRSASGGSVCADDEWDLVMLLWMEESTLCRLGEPHDGLFFFLACKLRVAFDDRVRPRLVLVYLCVLVGVSRRVFGENILFS